MKKMIISAAAILLAAASANAQIGVIGGVTSSSSDITSACKDIAESQNVTQYHAGIVYRVGLPMGLYVQPGVVYDMKGQALKNQIQLASTSYKVDIDTKTGYVEIPIQLGYQLDFSNALSAYAFVEPYAGYAITTESKTEFENAAQKSLAETAASALGYKLDTSNSDDDKWDGRERLEYGVGAGVGVLLFKHIGISAKYFWDLGNVYNEDGQTSISASSMYEATKNKKCSGIMASLTLYF